MATHRIKRGLEQEITEHLRNYFAAHHQNLPPDGLYDRILEHVERPLIMETLRATKGNQLKAAKLLGLNRNTLRKKIVALQLADAIKPRRSQSKPLRRT